MRAFFIAAAVIAASVVGGCSYTEKGLDVLSDVSAEQYEKWCDTRSPEFRKALRDKINSATHHWEIPDICQPKAE